MFTDFNLLSGSFSALKWVTATRYVYILPYMYWNS